MHAYTRTVRTNIKKICCHNSRSKRALSVMRIATYMPGWTISGTRTRERDTMHFDFAHHAHRAPDARAETPTALLENGPQRVPAHTEHGSRPAAGGHLPDCTTLRIDDKVDYGLRVHAFSGPCLFLVLIGEGPAQCDEESLSVSSLVWRIVHP